MYQNNSIPFEQVIQSLMQILEGQGYSALYLSSDIKGYTEKYLIPIFFYRAL